MKFVDLFAGLGGFHQAITSAIPTAECVYACEIIDDLRSLYEANFGMYSAGDIRDTPDVDIPAHDLLAAGFPCQPFSKAGSQNGFRDTVSGMLFHEILRFIDHGKPEWVILENVPNLIRHDSEATWAKITFELQARHYAVDKHELSPYDFGVPQVRKRIFIVAHKSNLKTFEWPSPTGTVTHISDVLDPTPDTERYGIPRQLSEAIQVWQEFLDRFPTEDQLPSFPIWGMEFGANYPYVGETPHTVSKDRLRVYRGALGRTLTRLDDPMSGLPSYAKTPQSEFPRWKQRFIFQNRDLYERNESWIAQWKEKLEQFKPSLQKLEWNAKGEVRDLNQLILQTRPSGIRAKRPNAAPALVAMTSSQVPIIPWRGTYLSPRECARLQSFDDPNFVLPKSKNRAYHALGNAVNVKVVTKIVESMIEANYQSKTVEGERFAGVHD